MYNKSKNKVLFAIFILIVLLIVFILVLSVYNSKENKNVEEYKISLNNSIYDKEFNYVSLKNDAILKREWDGNYYLIENSSSKKYELGTEPVLYDKSKNQLTLYGTIYQVYENGEAVQKTGKTAINNLSDFQFFKLSDRKYLIIGSNIKSNDFSTVNYLIVSIDKAGNATLLNNDVNIKTINPLILSTNNIKFDIANEKIIIGEKEVDLKKINGSTNEYVEEKEENKKPSNESINTDNNTNNQNNNNSNNSNTSSNSQIYNQIISQIINISGLVSSNINKTNLYKNVSLRSVKVGASYLDVTYSIIDPQNKYLSIFLALEDEDENVNFYYLNKDSTGYRISGLMPNKQYKLSLNYIVSGNSSSQVADSIIALTSTDPTSVRITKLNELVVSYKVKMYNEYEFSSAYVVLTNCEGSVLGYSELNIQNALSNLGDTGEFILNPEYEYEYVCLNLSSVKDANGNDITINSYHKVKIR